VVSTLEEMEQAIKDQLQGIESLTAERMMSAEELSNEASLPRLVAQRHRYRNSNWKAIADNHAHSVFYQLDLHDAARQFAENGIELPGELSQSEPLIKLMSDSMFRAEVYRHCGKKHDNYEDKAFEILRSALTSTVLFRKELPIRAVCSDQIVWSRSPVRIDIAGGWTDTPPYCLMEGGSVINMSIELNGQPPLQTYIRPCKEPHIVCRSIDLGAAETISTYEQLLDFKKVGSPFSIPKAALALAGYFSNGLSQALFQAELLAGGDFTAGLYIDEWHVILSSLCYIIFSMAYQTMPVYSKTAKIASKLRQFGKIYLSPSGHRKKPPENWQ